MPVGMAQGEALAARIGVEKYSTVQFVLRDLDK